MYRDQALKTIEIPVKTNKIKEMVQNVGTKSVTDIEVTTFMGAFTVL